VTIASGTRQWLGRALEHSFVGATGAAAFLHSTWAIGTLFAGNIPQEPFTLAWWGWHVPAALLAFSVDVGQIMTSVRIKRGERSPWMFVTFFVLAMSTYFFQWVYIAHHMPALALGEGVRAEWIPLVTLIRDASIWIIPAFLPLATILYTLSGGQGEAVQAGEGQGEPKTQEAALEAISAPPVVGVELLPFGHTVPELAEIASMQPMPSVNGSTASGSAPKSNTGRKSNKGKGKTE